MAERSDLRSLRLDKGTLQPRRGPWRRYGPFLLILALVAAGAFALLSGPRETAVETVTAPPPGRPPGEVTLSATGYVVAARKAALSPKIGGRLAYLGVEEGSTVTKGQILARLESEDLQANVTQAEAEVAAAEADLVEARAGRDEADREAVRQATLLREEIGTRRDVEKAEAAAEQARARVNAAEKRLAARRAGEAYARDIHANSIVVAPFDGVVLTKDADVGESVAPALTGGGTTRGSIVTLADMDSLEVEADVSEANIASIRAGMPAEIVLDAYPGRPYPAVVHQIVPTADRQKATVQVKVRFTGDRDGVLPEMSARADFLDPEASGPAAGRKVIALPGAAVRRIDGAWTVLLAEAGTVRRNTVELAAEPNPDALVVSGLSGGEEVVLDPPEGLEPGARIRVKGAGAD